MNYNLHQFSSPRRPSGLKTLLSLIRHEKRNLLITSLAILINCFLNLSGPYIIGYTIDNFLITGQYHGVVAISGLLLIIYIIIFFTSYLQGRLMGNIGQKIIYKLRNRIFSKLQELPITFFQQNKSGDLISRINHDTEKLDVFFSQYLTQLASSVALISGVSIFMLSLHIKLGLVTLAPAFIILLFTKLVSPWTKRKNSLSLRVAGDLSAQVKESLDNFKVIVAFNRRDYFRKRLATAYQKTYQSNLYSGLANNIFYPVYNLVSGFAQLGVLAYGINLVMNGELTIGLLVSFTTYCINFYNPLKQLANYWTNFQLAMAAWERIFHILSMETNLKHIKTSHTVQSSALIEFKQVNFEYCDGREILKDINLKLIKGKKYALIGPTGGGKTTTASLMARLYDPTTGIILLDGKDIREYDCIERSQKIGFILQEPFLFNGTVKDNILYGNPYYSNYDQENLKLLLKEKNIEELLSFFDEGLNTNISSLEKDMSLGSIQVIAFIRAVLRNPEILILDEATANLDTVTEQYLQKILDHLPEDITLVTIAHRLNTIQDADEIFFVNHGNITLVGSFEEAVTKLKQEVNPSK